MNLSEIQSILRTTVTDAAKREFGVELRDLPIEVPPKTELGDAAFPVAFELAKLIKEQTGEKQNPRAIAEVLKVGLEKLEFVSHV